MRMTVAELKRRRFLEQHGPRAPIRNWDGTRVLFLLLALVLGGLAALVYVDWHSLEFVLLGGTSLMLLAALLLPDCLLNALRSCLAGTGGL
jgi:hypothetical protein